MGTKILFFDDNLTFGGVEDALLQLMNGLNRDLWEPVLIYHPSGSILPLFQRAEKLGIRTIETPLMPLGITGLKRMSQFINLLRTEQPAIFHAHLSWPLACKWGIVASFFAFVPATVVTEHLFLDIPYSRTTRFQQFVISQRVAKYITVSRDISEKLSDTFGIPKQKIRVIHNGVDTTRFVPVGSSHDHKLRDGSKRPLILTVARLNEQKGHSYLLEAALEVPNAVFAIVGEGSEQGALEKQVRKLKLQDRVLFFGFQNDIQNWLSACDVFVLPSLYEGFSIAILEAMAAGKPVIATDIPGNREVIVHKKNGWLIPPRNSVALAAAIRSVLADPALRQSMGQAGKETVAQKFSMDEMSRQVKEVYTECMQGRR